MTIPFSQVKPASLKMKVLPRYPAAFRAGPGIAITQASGIVTTSVDFANMERDDNTPLDGLYVGAWDATDNLFKLVLADWLKGDKGDQGNPGPANASDYETLAQAEGATISAPVMYLRTAGYAAAGDSGGALYKRVTSLLSGTLGFQSDDGAWWQLSDFDVRPQMAGAKDDVSADASAGIQAAVDHVVAVAKGTVQLAGRFLLGSTVDILGGVTIRGANKLLTAIYPITAITAFAINTNDSVILENFLISYGDPGTASGITVTGPVVNAGSVFRDLIVTNIFVGIDFARACQYLVDNVVVNASAICIRVVNAHNADEGDSTICNSILSGTGSGLTTGIQFQSSGGLKVHNNKIISHQYGVNCALSDGAATTGLYFANNSVEGITSTSYSFSRQGTTGSLTAVTISGGDCSGPFGINVVEDAAGPWLTLLVVTGVAYIAPGTGTQAFADIASTLSFVIANNVIISHGGTVYKVITSASADHGVVGPNVGVGTFTASSIASTNTTTISPT